MNLAEIGITKEQILEGITEKLSEMLYEEIAADIRREVKENLIKKSEGIVNEVINETAKKTFETTYQPVDEWGEKTGEKTTLKEIFKEKCMKWWDEEVDKQTGEPSGSYYGRMKRSEFIVKKTMSHILQNDLQVETRKIFEESKIQVKQALFNILKELVEKKF